MAVSPALVQLFSPFDTLDDHELERISDAARMERVPKGTFIFKRGKDLPAVHYLVAGTVDLVDVSFNSESVNGEGERRIRALANISPSPVSAMAKTDVELLVIDHATMELARAWAEEKAFVRNQGNVMAAEGDHNDWMVCLLDSPLFAQIPPTQIQQLFARFEAVEVSQGEQIVREGATGDFFYVIESGQAEVSTLLEGKVATLSSGKYFGEEALVGEAVRNASVVMKTPGVLMRLSQEDFKALLHEPLIRYIKAEQLNGQAEAQYRIVDVRLPIEHRKLHVKDSANIPLASLRKRLAQLDRDAIYVITDDGGKRSEVAAHLMCQAGFTTYILENSFEHYLLGGVLEGPLKGKESLAKDSHLQERIANGRPLKEGIA